MKKLLVPLIACIIWVSCSDDPIDMMIIDPVIVDVCDSDRYSDSTFADVDSITVKFADADPFTAHPNDLYMDIYMPVGDTLSERPLIIWAFGGAFVSGDRKQMRGLAIDAAERGFVSAAIDYRLYSLINGIPDTITMMNTVVKAASDMKAAIRHF